MGSEKTIYEVTVWSMIDGDIIEKLWEASSEELDDIEEKYRDNPLVEIRYEQK